MADYNDCGAARPVAPLKPEPGECCGRGCDPCVYDRYCDLLDQYRAALAAWEQRTALKA